MKPVSVFVALLAGLVVGTACTNPPAPRTEYLLRGEFLAATDPVAVEPAASIGVLSIAPYLERPGIVVEIAPGRLRAAGAHVWAEPLDAGLRSLLRSELARALETEVASRGRSGVVVDVRIERLHGTEDGRALIEATWRLERGGDASYRFADTRMVEADGYPGLVEAERALVARLADAIAASIVKVATGRASIDRGPTPDASED